MLWIAKVQAAVLANLESYVLHNFDYKAFDTVLLGYLRSPCG